MKNFVTTVLLFLLTVTIEAQTDKEQLALKVAKAEDENLTKLTEYIWKRSSNVFIDNQLKFNALSEFKFNAEGKLEVTVLEAKTTVKQKPGLRGAAQKNVAEDKADYVNKALQLSLAYAFMSKGELVDFFDKATLSEKDGLLDAVASDVIVKGDKLILRIDPVSNLIVYKEFYSLLGTDKIDGKLLYDKFSNGTMHGTSTTLNLPVQKMTIEGLNQDYTIRIK
jgi:hypothetical protein